MFACGRRNQRSIDFIKGSNALESHYVLGSTLGNGCSGCVRECIELSTGFRLACKTILKQNCLSWSDVSEDARTEVEIMHAVSTHPNVVKLHQVFEDARGIHLIMELCEGGDLFDEIKKAAFTEHTAANIFRQIVDAVSFCHSAGIMHRDVKPENVLLVTRLARNTRRRKSDAESQANCGISKVKEVIPIVKLADFGLAVKVDSKGYSPAFGFAGSPFYAAPEVVKGELYGLPADIWSLGVVLYTLLAGNLPFAGENDQETFRQVCRGRPSFSGSAWSLVSSEAKILIRQMLSLDPKCRPSAHQLLHHPWLQAMCYSSPAPPSPPSPPLYSYSSFSPAQHVSLAFSPKSRSATDSCHATYVNKHLVKSELQEAPSTPGGSCYPLPVRRTLEGSKPKLSIPSRNNPFVKNQPIKSITPSPLSTTLPTPPCPSPLSLSPVASSNYPSNPSAFNSLIASHEQSNPSTPKGPKLPAFSSSSAFSPYSSPSPYPSPASTALRNDSEAPYPPLKPNCKDYVLAEDGCILFTSQDARPIIGMEIIKEFADPDSDSSGPLLCELELEQKKLSKLSLVGDRASDTVSTQRRPPDVVGSGEIFTDWKFDIAQFLKSLPWNCLQERSKFLPKTHPGTPGENS